MNVYTKKPLITNPNLKKKKQNYISQPKIPLSTKTLLTNEDDKNAHTSQVAYDA